MNDLIDSNTLNRLKKELPQDVYVQLLNLYITDTQNHLNQLEKFIDNNNSSAARMTAHSIKGSSSNMGAIKLTKLAGEIETLCKEGNISKASQYLNKLRGVAVQTLEQLS